MRTATSNRGFTLIEMLVSVALFIVVMVVALGALLAMSQSDRKAESLKVVINNLNSALDSMSRNMRTGRYFHCDTITSSSGFTSGVAITTPNQCPITGGNYVAFLQSDGKTWAAYCYNGSQLLRETTTTGTFDNVCSLSGTNFVPLTSPEMQLTTMQFYVSGIAGQLTQPRIVILLQGLVQVSATQQTQLHLQTTVTQRLYNQ